MILKEKRENYKNIVLLPFALQAYLIENLPVWDLTERRISRVQYMNDQILGIETIPVPTYM